MDLCAHLLKAKIMINEKICKRHDFKINFIFFMFLHFLKQMFFKTFVMVYVIVRYS